MQGKSKIINITKYLVVQTFRCIFFIISSVFSLIFSILHALLSTYGDPVPEDDRPEEPEYLYSKDENGNVITSTDNGYPRM